MARASDSLIEALAGEPIQTRTMARILAGQGHYARAWAIYRKLLRDAGDHAALQSEAEAAREKAGLDDDEEGEGPGSAECVTVVLGDGRALVAWRIGKERLQRTRALAEVPRGVPAPLVLRGIVITDSPGGAVRNESEVSVALQGEQVFRVARGGKLLAAVGIRVGDRFVSIAHAPPLAA